MPPPAPPPGLARAQDAARELWPRAAAVIEPLAGGITNENYKVTVGADAYVIRVFGQDAELLLIDRAREVIVVADSSKIGRVAFARICGMSRIDELITDAEADRAALAAIEERGVRVTTV